MTTLSDLIARLEAASPGDEGKCVHAALQFAYSQGWIDTETLARAVRYAMAGAFLDAALTLKQTLGYMIIEFENGGFQIDLDNELVEAKTAPLGVCLCVVKAREAGR